MSKEKINNALISLTNKNKIEDLAKYLQKLNINIFSTGGTYRYLQKYSIDCNEIKEITNFPEIFDGRVKTLHPKIFGGILSRRGLKKDQREAKKNNIKNIDLVIVNLYNFEQTLEKSKSPNIIIESIDIGGPSLIRAAAKNFFYTTIVVDPEDYCELMRQLNEQGATTIEFRKYLAQKAFEITYKYDSLIFEWFQNYNNKVDEEKIKKNINLNLEKTLSLRYGENPHQSAGFYSSKNAGSSLLLGKKIQGIDLSYNNINDVEAGINIVCEFKNPAVSIIKHANPCGVSEANDINIAWENAYNTDPTSAFGGIVAINRTIHKKLAKKLTDIFLEVVIAPKVSNEAKKILSTKKNLRVLIYPNFLKPNDQTLHIRSILGGFLIQTQDNVSLSRNNFKIVTKRKPTNEEKRDLLFAWIVAKHTKSNAIIYAKDRSTKGIGAGQMSRIDSAFIAKKKAADIQSNLLNNNQILNKCVVASDAFFPFADGLITAANAGVTAVIQPGGSIRDKQIIKEANKRNLAMVFTSLRHFKH